MLISELRALVAFTGWANERILAACELLPDGALGAPASPDPGWGSLRGILVHALDTEYGWRMLLQGQDASELLSEADFPDVAALRARWAEERAAWRAYLDALSEDAIGAPYGAGQGGPAVWQTVLHVVVHGVQHRAEVAAILTGYGCSPGDLDFDVFLADASHERDAGRMPHPAHGRLSDYVRALRPGGRYVMAGGSNRQIFEALLRGPLVSLRCRASVRNVLAQPSQRDLQFLGELLADGRGSSLTAGVG